MAKKASAKTAKKPARAAKPVRAAKPARAAKPPAKAGARGAAAGAAKYGQSGAPWWKQFLPR